MKIGIQTWGSDGDIHPFVALAARLSEAGHEVTLAITSAERKDYTHFAKRLRFRLIPVGHIGIDDDDLVRIAGKMYRTVNPLTQFDIIIEEMFDPGVDAMYQTAQSLCADNDCLIGHQICHPVQLAAEKARKPYLTITLNHSTLPSECSPPTGFPNLGKWLNMVAWRLVLGIVNRHVLRSINWLRRKEGVPLAPSFRDIWESPLCNLIAVSSEICSSWSDWGSNQHVCGFFRIPEEGRPWDTPDSLIQFLSAGAPPVFMTFGSMIGIERDPSTIAQATDLLVKAARIAGCRAIIQSRWEAVSSIPDYEEIYRIGEAPHSRIFPSCAAVVHHGGAGTTQTATLWGCPSVVVAHIADQFFWGRELKRLGVAPRLLDRRTVTPERLARQIRRVLDTPAMGERARALGNKLRAENGVDKATSIIERTMAELGN